MGPNSDPEMDLDWEWYGDQDSEHDRDDRKVDQYGDDCKRMEFQPGFCPNPSGSATNSKSCSAA